MSTVHVLANPAARGRGPHIVDHVLEAIRRTDADAVLLNAPSRDAALDSIRRAVDEGASRLILVGGDGLVHLATQVLANTKTVLGVVPFGTGNDFARAFDLCGHDVAVAVANALAEPVAIDAIRTTHGWIASVAGVGFSAVVNARANRLPHPRGRGRYTLATLLELPRLRALPLRLTIDGEVREVEVTMAVAANSAYFGGGMAICPQADPLDGRLDILLVGAVGRATLLRFFPRVFRGTHVTHPAVTMLSARRLRIETLDAKPSSTKASSTSPKSTSPKSTSTDLWGDGENVGPLPLDLEVVPAALHLAGVERDRSERT